MPKREVNDMGDSTIQEFEMSRTSSFGAENVNQGCLFQNTIIIRQKMTQENGIRSGWSQPKVSS